MSPFALACLSYLSLALPGSTLGLLWPAMRATFQVPLADLGFILATGTLASILASAAVPRLIARLGVGWLLALGSLAVALALGVEAAAPYLWIIVAGSAVFSLGFGSIDAALNAHAAHTFGARQINWMHATYGLGATAGPLLVTALLGHGTGWRVVLAIFAAIMAAFGLAFVSLRGAWSRTAALPVPPAQPPTDPGTGATARPAGFASLFAPLLFTAVETGIESGAGIWGFVFLASGRHLPPAAAGAAVSAYWAMMVVGRAVLGPVAERLGAQRVLSAAVAGVALGGAVMSVPGPAWPAVAGLMLLGLAASSVFPLLTLTTASRVRGSRDATTRTVGLQVAASAVGSAALPSAIGVVLGAAGAAALGPLLLALGVAMWALYAPVARSGGRVTA